MVAMWFLFVGNKKALSIRSQIVRYLDRCKYWHCSGGLKRTSEFISTYQEVFALTKDAHIMIKDRWGLGCALPPVFMGMGRLWEVLQEKVSNCSATMPPPACFTMHTLSHLFTAGFHASLGRVGLWYWDTREKAVWECCIWVHTYLCVLLYDMSRPWSAYCNIQTSVL